MQLIDGRPVYSATDLVGFLACEHLTNLERAALAGLVKRPMRVDPELDRVVKRGFQHERRFLGDLRAEGLGIEEVHVPEGDRGTGYRAAAEATVAAMRAGAAVIYQATFFDGRWLGFADFLRRVETPSELGPWSYEVWDTKLARHTKGSAVLQLSLYSEQLAALQGLRPELMHVALGGSARDVDHLRVADYAAYVRTVRRQFEAFTEGAAAAPEYPPATRPDPVEHCEICRWRPECEARRRETDDLSLVAGISAHQRTRAADARRADADGAGRAAAADGSATRGHDRDEPRARARAGAHPGGGRRRPAARPVRAPRAEPPARRRPRTRPRAAEPARAVARGPVLRHRRRSVRPGRRGRLPVRGARARRSSGQTASRPSTPGGRSRTDDVTLDAERRAFEELIDFFMRPPGGGSGPPHLPLRAVRAHGHGPPDGPLRDARAGGGPAAARGHLRGPLSGRPPGRPRVGRELLDQEARAAVRLQARGGPAGRRLEHRRVRGVAGAGTDGTEVHGRDPGILDRIERYNRDDCVSNRLLRDWLEVQRVALAADLDLPSDASLPRPKPGQPPPENLAEALQRVAEVADRADGRCADDRQRPDAGPARVVAACPAAELASPRGEVRLVALLLPHDRAAPTTTGSRNPTPSAAWSTSPSSGRWPGRVVYRYRFPPQEHDIDVGTEVRMPDPRGGRRGRQPRGGRRRRQRRRDDRPEAGPQGRRPAPHLAGAVPARSGPRPRRPACCASAAGSPITASTRRPSRPPMPRRVDSCCANRRGSARRPASPSRCRGSLTATPRAGSSASCTGRSWPSRARRARARRPSARS